MKIHGMWGTHLYKAWHNMKQRCRNEYLNKGIKVCEAWKDFIPFQEWAELNGYDEKLSLDRINNDGDYEPNNCRWTTRAVQTRNTRKLFSHNSSGFRGVSRYKMTGKWRSYININNTQKYIGLFSTPLQAAFRRDKYVLDNNLEHTLNFNWKHAQEGD